MAKTSMLNNSKLQAFLAIGPIAIFFLLFFGYFLFIFGMLGFSIQQETLKDGEIPGFPIGMAIGMGFFFAFFFLAICVSMFAYVYFIIHAVKNPNLDGVEKQNIRVIWILVLALISYLGPLIYWIIEIKSKQPKPYIPS